MDHIRQYDWCVLQRESEHFLTERDIKNSVIERILSGKFKDPLLSSSDSEDENSAPKFNWHKIFNKNKNENKAPFRFTPGLKGIPGYPKLSALSLEQHHLCLKVLAAENPLVSEHHSYPRPTRVDHKTFAEIQPLYEAEQKEYIEWAKKLWSVSQSIRVIRPRPVVESVYDAEFDFRAQLVKSVPYHYTFAGQISLESHNKHISIVHQKHLIKVHMSQLPVVQIPDLKQKYTILRKKPTLQSKCEKHPCHFILPNETTVSTLPLTELHERLAEYSAVNGAQFIISEEALNAIVEHKRSWLLPIGVYEEIGLDGDSKRVYVIGNEFYLRKEHAAIRTYTAFKHLLHLALIVPPKDSNKSENYTNDEVDLSKFNDKSMEMSSDEEENLVIDIDTDRPETDLMEKKSVKKQNVTQYKCDTVPCRCKEQPPPRSYTKWEVTDKSSNQKIGFIVHCAHKAKSNNSELILEPIPEYQLDLGGTMQLQDKIRSLALSLFLRHNATLLNVRLDGQSGDMVTYEYSDLQQLESKYGNTLIAQAANTIYSTLSQIQGLMPGNYVLRHGPEHGSNALVYVARSFHTDTHSLKLEICTNRLADEDEAQYLKTPPVLGPVLLPYHKTRTILPLAFSPCASHVAKEFKKPLNKLKIPPPAFQFALEGTDTGSSTISNKNKKWPKKKKSNLKKPNTSNT